MRNIRFLLRFKSKHVDNQKVSRVFRLQQHCIGSSSHVAMAAQARDRLINSHPSSMKLPMNLQKNILITKVLRVLTPHPCPSPRLREKEAQADDSIRFKGSRRELWFRGILTINLQKACS
jgi:hypothetical protein